MHSKITQSSFNAKQVMDMLNKSRILDYSPETCLAIRKQYDLDKPGRMDEAIDILEEWIKKQEHFTVKTFPRNYLERVIINNKGSLEACKKRLDKSCVFRTLLPDFFGTVNLEEYDGYKIFAHGFMPTLTPDHVRIVLVYSDADKFPQDKLLEYYKHFILICEYLQSYDYSNGVSYIVDFRDCNVLEFVKASNLFDFKKVMDVSTDGYSLRIKGLHVLGNSRVIDILIMFFRQAFKAKVGERIYYHKSVESLYNVFPKEILPQEYGGKGKCIADLRDDLLNEIKSKEFVEYCNEMKKARTNEDFRQTAKFNEEYMGMPGTFRTLTVD